MSVSGADQQATRVIPQEYVSAFILVTSLFFMWAVAHNMNDILIRQFQKALDLSRGQASFIQVSFYLAYFFAAIPAGYAMKKLGFKRAILTGLLLYALGAALFFPAAAVGSYSFFLVALFIIATGIVFLETSGSGYITLVGDKATAARRINFAQSFNGLGGFIAPLIGGVFIFSGIEHSPDAIAALSPQALQEYRALEARQVQLPYLSLAGILLFVALLVALTRFPSRPPTCATIPSTRRGMPIEARGGRPPYASSSPAAGRNRPSCATRTRRGRWTIALERD